LTHSQKKPHREKKGNNSRMERKKGREGLSTDAREGNFLRQAPQKEERKGLYQRGGEHMPEKNKTLRGQDRFDHGDPSLSRNEKALTRKGGTPHPSGDSLIVGEGKRKRFRHDNGRGKKRKKKKTIHLHPKRGGKKNQEGGEPASTKGD